MKSRILIYFVVSLLLCFTSCNVATLFDDDRLDLLLIDKSAAFTDSLKTIVADFEAQYGCEVVIHNLRETDIRVILDYIKANPDSADLIELDRWTLCAFVSGNIVQPLPDSLLKAIPRQLTSQCRFNNNPVSWPWLNVSRRLYINRDAASPVPAKPNGRSDWAGFKELLWQLSANPEKKAFAINILDKKEFFGFFVYAGNMLYPNFADSLALMKFNENQVIAVYTLLGELIPFSAVGTNDEILRRFATGQVLSVIDSPMGIYRARQFNAGLKVDEYPAPYGNKPGNTADIEVISLALNNKNENKELSLQLMQFLYENSEKLGFPPLYGVNPGNVQSGAGTVSLKESRPFNGNAALFTKFFHHSAYSYLLDKSAYRNQYDNMKSKLEENLRKNPMY